MLNNFFVLMVTLIFSCVVVSAENTKSDKNSEVELRLYALDCGRLEFEDLAVFADTGEYDGKAGTLMASCFLIRHPKGDLLWDAGLGDHQAKYSEGVVIANYRAFVGQTLESQLNTLGLNYDDLDFFAFSHGHADHLGNANKLGKAMWLVNRKELSWLETAPKPPRTNPSLIGSRDPVQTTLLDGDYDVFGDKTVQILSTPGHTPGHQSLLLDLPQHGVILISGDLYHTEENRIHHRMPIFNVDRADTLAAMDRVEAIVRHKNATVIIQHSVQSFNSLPKFPSFLN